MRGCSTKIPRGDPEDEMSEGKSGQQRHRQREGNKAKGIGSWMDDDKRYLQNYDIIGNYNYETSSSKNPKDFFDAIVCISRFFHPELDFTVVAQKHILLQSQRLTISCPRMYKWVKQVHLP